MAKVENLTRLQATAESEKARILESVETYKSKNNMAEFTIASLKKTIEKVEGELAAACKYREKYTDAQVEIKRIEGEKKLEVRSLENSMKVLNGSLVALQHKYNEDVDSLSRKNQELDSKQMASSLRNKEL